MKFNSIKANIASAIVKQCQDKLTDLAIDLSVRETNCHVGSGLGGNNFQVLTMFGMNHSLCNRDISIDIEDDAFIWGSKFLTNSSLVSIRHTLDKTFDNIKDFNKLMPIMFLNESNIHKTLKAYENNFPYLKDIFDGNVCVDLKNISLNQQIIIAFIITSKLANELDNNITKNIASVGLTLAHFTPEVILLAVRKYIGIERLIKFDIDELPSWENTLGSVNRRIN